MNYEYQKPQFQINAMKAWLVAILVCSTITARSIETNAVVFPILYSTNGTPLMTNAEYRTTSGSKVFFLNEKYRSFEARQLDTNVLKRLGLTVEALELAKAAQSQKFERIRQAELKAKAAQIDAARIAEEKKRQQEAKDFKEAEETIRERERRTVIITEPPGHRLNSQQSAGAYVP